MGLGAQVREACILEEEASGAHCVGLKQTILFPFVTLGSLINFCDCLMAGGTSRQNHSEVGSSYIHFNFTPEGDKTTPSLIGDVPRGVMLNQRPIFLGGQGGMVGPLRIGYGNVVAAGSILRKDYPEDNTLIVGKTHKGGVRDFVPGSYPNFAHLVENNILYLANLAALEEWYRYVRRRFLEMQEFGSLIYGGLIDKLRLARKERVERLKATAKKAYAASASSDPLPRGANDPGIAAKKEFWDNLGRIESLFSDRPTDERTETCREEFLSDLFAILGTGVTDYVGTIRGLPKDVSAKGVRWLDRLVALSCMSASAAVPSLRLFPKLAAGPC
jgi:UDP-N-acetylglucosamine/UDP-N-acetylgalactosamine diphosphorylase